MDTAAGRTALNQKGFATRQPALDPAREPDPPAPVGRLVTPARHRSFIAAVILLDLFAVGVGFVLPAFTRFSAGDLREALGHPSGPALVGLGAVLWITWLSARGAYFPRVMVSVSEQILRIASAVIPVWILTEFLAFALKATTPFESRLVVLLSLPSVLATLILARLVLVRPLARRTYPRLARGAVLVLGDTDRAERLARDLAAGDTRHRNVVLLPLAETTPDEVTRAIQANEIGEVVIEPEGRSLDQVFDTAFACLDAQSEVRIVSSQFRVLSGRSAFGAWDGIPVMRFRRFDLDGPEALIKRAADILGSGIGLLVLSPVLLAIGLAVKLSSQGPILFRQERVGRRGRRFTMLKFRTMVAGNDPAAHKEYLEAFIREGSPATVAEDGTKIYKIAADPRVTRLGAWLRALSLDELPQLWNVLAGDMTLVGPRPCLPYEWEMYRPWQRRRLDVTPGCTGLWQVTARSLVSFDEMVILDLHYAHHGTIGGDLWLLMQTIPAMIRGRGGY